jgi:ribosomal protein S18 acetylase RimI-like enzyme
VLEFFCLLIYRYLPLLEKSVLVKDYQLRVGSPQEGALLLQFMQQTYQELFPTQKNFAHLASTVKQYFTTKTPLWWVVEQKSAVSQRYPVACLWMGNAYEQITGDRYAHIFLLYVKPEHRRQGIGTALLTHAQNWALARGDHQIGLHVFTNNQNALKLYQQLGYQTQSLLMVKSLT